MRISGVQLSAFGRSALGGNSGLRSTEREELGPVQKSDPLKDATSSEYRELQELKQRDREVRQHEQAHVAAGGQYVSGGASYSYQRGPDGQQYAVGGEVQIDTSAVPGDPAATVVKMQTVKRAAMAPAEPSAQDRAVAAEASMKEAEARAEQRNASNDDDAAAGPREPEDAAEGRRNNEVAVRAYAAGAASGTAPPQSALDLIA
jgi:hypothetical protein